MKPTSLWIALLCLILGAAGCAAMPLDQAARQREAALAQELAEAKATEAALLQTVAELTRTAATNTATATLLLATATPSATPLPPTATPVPPTATPTPAPPTATGVVRGVVVDESTGQAMVDLQVSLGLIEYDEDGKPFRIHCSAVGGRLARSAYTNITGAFTIEAPPGTYALKSPGCSTFDRIARDGTGAALIIEVDAGQTIDLGMINVTP